MKKISKSKIIISGAVLVVLLAVGAFAVYKYAGVSADVQASNRWVCNSNEFDIGVKSSRRDARFDSVPYKSLETNPSSAVKSLEGSLITYGLKDFAPFIDFNSFQEKTLERVVLPERYKFKGYTQNGNSYERALHTPVYDPSNPITKLLNTFITPSADTVKLELIRSSRDGTKKEIVFTCEKSQALHLGIGDVDRYNFGLMSHIKFSGPASVEKLGSFNLQSTIEGYGALEITLERGNMVYIGSFKAKYRLTDGSKREITIRDGGTGFPVKFERIEQIEFYKISESGAIDQEPLVTISRKPIPGELNLAGSLGIGPMRKDSAHSVAELERVLSKVDSTYKYSKNSNQSKPESSITFTVQNNDWMQFKFKPNEFWTSAEIFSNSRNAADGYAAIAISKSEKEYSIDFGGYVQSSAGSGPRGNFKLPVKDIEKIMLYRYKIDNPSSKELFATLGGENLTSPPVLLGATLHVRDGQDNPIVRKLNVIYSSTEPSVTVEFYCNEGQPMLEQRTNINERLVYSTKACVYENNNTDRAMLYQPYAIVKAGNQEINIKMTNAFVYPIRSSIPAPTPSPSRTVAPLPFASPSRTVAPAPSPSPSRTVALAPSPTPSRTVVAYSSATSVPGQLSLSLAPVSTSITTSGNTKLKATHSSSTIGQNSITFYCNSQNPQVLETRMATTNPVTSSKACQYSKPGTYTPMAVLKVGSKSVSAKTKVVVATAQSTQEQCNWIKQNILRRVLYNNYYQQNCK